MTSLHQNDRSLCGWLIHLGEYIKKNLIFDAQARDIIPNDYYTFHKWNKSGVSNPIIFMAFTILFRPTLD